MSSSANTRDSVSVSKSATTSSSRLWSFRALTVAGGGLLLLSWFLPWWRAVILELQRYVVIRPWGLEHNLGDFADYIKTATLPSWFAPLMWAYLGVSIVVLLFSLFAPEKRLRLGKFSLSLPQILVAGIGVSYIVVVLVAAVYASIRVDEFWHIKLIGKTYVQVGEIERSYVETGFELGYWLACTVGLLLLVLGLLRNKIVGEPKLIG